MTALDSYYLAIRQGKLPATVPVADGMGHSGIATQKFPIGESARALVESPEPQRRAAAAIMVCHSARSAIESSIALSVR